MLSTLIRHFCAICLAASLSFVLTTPVHAGEGRSGGRLLLTNGISTVEGATGGGIASWR